MGGIDYKKLYALQDRVLSITFEVENEFYLTGGTCISRFYIAKRYSEAVPMYISFLMKGIETRRCILFLIIAYDIADDNRRRHIVQLLKDYGYRVNYSVFECELKKDQLPFLKNKISRIINKKEDTVLYYELCRTCKMKRCIDGLRLQNGLDNIINI